MTAENGVVQMKTSGNSNGRPGVIRFLTVASLLLVVIGILLIPLPGPGFMILIPGVAMMAISILFEILVRMYSGKKS